MALKPNTPTPIELTSPHADLLPFKVEFEPLIGFNVVAKLLSEDKSPEEIVRIVRGLVGSERQRLNDLTEILRDYSEKHPKTVGMAETRRFRHTQYKWLMSFASVVLIGSFIAIALNPSYLVLGGVGLVFLATVPPAVNIIALNGRERDADIDRMTDLQGKLVSILNDFIKKPLGRVFEGKGVEDEEK